MKAITVHQPWASLIAAGRKRYETRSWAPPDALRGQRIAIHAGLGFTYFTRHTIIGMTMRSLHGPAWDTSLPAGAVVATATLADWQRTQAVVCSLSVDDLAFGDFSNDRWAWDLRDVEPLYPPMPARGRQRLWEWEPPA